MIKCKKIKKNLKRRKTMSNIEDYNMKLEVIKAIPDDQIKIPHSIPVGIYIQEAEYLVKWCLADKDELTEKGLDWTLVEDLPVRCGALREAEANWGIEWRTQEEAEKLWILESPKGYDLRNQMAHNFYYAFNDDPSLISKVNTFLEGNTHAHMIQCLNSFSVLGRANQELLTAIGFDLTLLDLAAQKSDELASIYADATRDREDFSEFKKIRDQAFTHVKEAVDKIRKCGQFVFWRTPGRVKGYRSNYLRRLSRRSTEDNTEPVPEPLPEPDELELETVTPPA
jgi:hypothetical protein